MGSGNSKPEPPKDYVWSSTAPVSFSRNLVESLQSNTENDSLRAKNLELHIQARVSEELKRLQAQESQKRKEILEQLSKAEASPENTPPKDLSRETVQKEIRELKMKLEERKKLQDVGDSVEKARESVVKCLRDNDRRPLNCDAEVAAFKEEVRKLEGRWVEKIVG